MKRLSVRIWRRSSNLKAWSEEWSTCRIYRRKIKTREVGECQCQGRYWPEKWIFVFSQSVALSFHMNILYSIEGDVVTQRPFIAWHDYYCSISNSPELSSIKQTFNLACGLWGSGIWTWYSMDGLLVCAPAVWSPSWKGSWKAGAWNHLKASWLTCLAPGRG